jgi:Holliday junction resolvasome RuvABC DNA-binding subunit
MIMEKKTIGRMISELEANLNACREADKIINEWKFRYTTASDELKPQLLKEMLHVCGFSPEEIDKMVLPLPEEDK